MQETLYQTADASNSIEDSGCRRLYQTADEEVFISDSGCKRLFIRQRMQETLYNRQWMQLSLYQTEDAGVSKVDPGVYRADVYTLSRA